jgi:hypothetical protein
MAKKTVGRSKPPEGKVAHASNSPASRQVEARTPEVDTHPARDIEDRDGDAEDPAGRQGPHHVGDSPLAKAPVPLVSQQ